MILIKKICANYKWFKFSDQKHYNSPSVWTYYTIISLILLWLPIDQRIQFKSVLKFTRHWIEVSQHIFSACSPLMQTQISLNEYPDTCCVSHQDSVELSGVLGDGNGTKVWKSLPSCKCCVNCLMPFGTKYKTHRIAVFLPEKIYF